MILAISSSILACQNSQGVVYVYGPPADLFLRLRPLDVWLQFTRDGRHFVEEGKFSVVKVSGIA